VLLIHGDSDDNVPIDQSRIMERALRRAGKSVRFVAIEREDHSLSHGTSDLTVMRELERFLAQHLGQ
jgi:dipeptidyl aminopeptidase/acylaminoacyl peptidase